MFSVYRGANNTLLVSKEPDDFFDWSVIGGTKPNGGDKRSIENLWDENKNNEWHAAQTYTPQNGALPGMGLKYLPRT